MKKTTFIILVFLLANNVLAQITEKTFYDFCQCDYTFGMRDSTRNSSPMWIDHTKSVEAIHYKGNIVNFKEYHRQNNEKTLKYEHILLDADTFRFVEYDTLMQPLAAGNVYFDRKRIVRSDSTFSRFHPDTYEETPDTIFHHFYPSVKHGNWHERQGNNQMGGSYKHGKKHGIWHKFNYETRYWKELEFVSDSLIMEEELNLAKKENVADELIELLTKNNDLSFKWKDGKLYIKTSITLFEHLKFKKDGTVMFRRSRSQKWTYNDQMKTIKVGETIFKINWVMEDFIELEANE